MLDGQIIPLYLLTRPNQPVSHRRWAKKRLTHIGKWFGHPGETYRTKAVFGGKRLGLGQSLTRDGGDIGAATTPNRIITQIRHRIRRGPVKGAADIVVTGAGRVQRQIFDLLVRNQQLGAQPLRIKRQPGLAQHRQLARQIGGIQCHLADD